MATPSSAIMEMGSHPLLQLSHRWNEEVLCLASVFSRIPQYLPKILLHARDLLPGMRRPMGDIMGTVKTLCLYFLFNFKRLLHGYVVLRHTYTSVYCVHCTSSCSLLFSPSSSSSSYSDLLLLMIYFQKSWYFVLKVHIKIRKGSRLGNIPGSIN